MCTKQLQQLERSNSIFKDLAAILFEISSCCCIPVKQNVFPGNVGREATNTIISLLVISWQLLMQKVGECGGQANIIRGATGYSSIFSALS